MKNTEFSFKLVAAVVLAGVFVAFAAPSHASKRARPDKVAGSAVVEVAAVDADPVAEPTE